jgi:integrase/recombinase XerD
MSKTLPKVLSKDDALRLVTAPETMTARARRGQLSVEGLRNRVVMELLYRCGLRNAEACNLTVADVDVAKRWLHVRGGKGNKDRDVPMTMDTATWCVRWLEARVPGEVFVTTSKGTQMSERHVHRMVSTLAKELGVYVMEKDTLTPAHPHTLRHSYAKRLIENDVNLRHIQTLMGHASLATTQIYLYVEPEELQGAIDGVAAKWCSGVSEAPQSANDAT